MGQQDQRARHAHIFAKERHGHYPEPLWCSQRLFDVEDFGPEGSLILDPACGWGNILNAARAKHFRIAGFDIVDRYKLNPGRFYKHDFLNGAKLPTASHVMSIACNPPFDHVQAFCERACNIAQYKVAMIMLLRRIPAAHWLDQLPLETIYMLTPRPSMPPGEWIEAGNKPGGGTQDFVWLLFNCEQKPRRYPRVRWLHRDESRETV